MRHVVLGGGGIGGLLAGALARGGESVVLLLRPETVRAYPGRLRIESEVLGEFVAEVGAASTLDPDADVVWVATKATQLEQALALAPPERVGAAAVVPLLNGVDHVGLLRRRYPNVVAAAIRVESERAPGWVIRQTSPFLRVDLAGLPEVRDVLAAAGIQALLRDDETTLLWEKLAFLAPVALATSARAATLGAVRHDPEFVGCRAEAVAVARAEGARVDAAAVEALHEGAPESMRSSMQKDVAAGREPELDAVAGPIIRHGAQHGIATPHTESVAAAVRARAARD